eukprot:451425_1
MSAVEEINQLLELFQSANDSKSDAKSVICICGQNLMRCKDASSVYEESNYIGCDKCGTFISYNDVVWHCTSQSNMHPDGYDVCDHCVNPQKFATDQKTNYEPIEQIKNCNIEFCENVKLLSNMMQKYQQHENKINSWDNNDDITTILNAFYHLLFQHDNKPQDFDYIYKSFGEKCELSRCTALRRQYGENDEIDISKQYNADNDTHLNAMNEFLDMIHCHFQHGYDIFRFTEKEQKLISEEIEVDVNENINAKINEKILKLKDILNKKKSNFSKHTNAIRFTRKTNKFVCDLGKFVADDDEKAVDESNITSYSFSYNFNYWKNCDDNEEIETVINGKILKIKDFYIGPKYSSLKDELFNNEIVTLSLSSFQNYVEKATFLQKTNAYLSTTANISQYFLYLKGLPYHPIHFGCNDGDNMSLNHILVMLIYCGTDVFQAKLSETYRALKNEVLDETKRRHSNFHYFGKNLKEAVEVFGVEYAKGNMKRVYHGINREMTFNGVQDFIYGIVSTTTNYKVAMNFSDGTGLVLEIVPSQQLKYFDCIWVAKYPNEMECLFVGGFSTINITNITNMSNGEFFAQYVAALRIIHSMIHTVYFENDCTMIHEINAKKTANIALLGDNYGDIPMLVKKIVLGLIQHECSKTEPQKYKKWQGVHFYIERLSHQFFSTQPKFEIDWESMCVGVLEKYDLSSCGYIGYNFLFSYFCNDDYQGVKLNFINTLFPSLTNIGICNLSSISTEFLNDIIQFLKTNEKTEIKKFAFMIAKKFGFGNVKQQQNAFKLKFEEIGWQITYKEFKNVSITDICLIINPQQK